MLSGSKPLKRHAGGICGSGRGAESRTAAASAAMCAGVVPQQPPTMLTKPLAANSPSTAAVAAGDSSYSPNAFGSPAFG